VGSLEGIVVRRSSDRAWVDVAGEAVSCALRGKLRNAGPLVAGDRVVVTRTSEGEGVLERVLPRRSELRRGPLTGEEEGRTTAANIDQLAIVISAIPPPPRWGLVDRLLVEAERRDLPSLLVLNKADLAPPGSGARAQVEEGVAVYRGLGIPAFITSALAPSVNEDLLSALRGRITVLSGHSGVGKSSLLNRLIPGANAPTGEVNSVTGKGRQTTTWAVLVPLGSGGYLVDTPGYREFSLGGMDGSELGRFYPEFRDAIGRCKFKDCLHRDEPRCQVKQALEEGTISKLRYQNYLQILSSLVDREQKNPPRRSARRRDRESS
jgi:ribosome biogenesis GTPase